VGTAATATAYSGTFHGTTDQVSSVRREVAKAELARKLSISADTAGRALRELADMDIVYHVPGHGYFSNTRGEE
jgi:DNA-binding transcriptional regulator YhcF (GntR family)